MGSTGAPWNIPYAEPTNNPRVWPALSEDVADAVAAGLSAAGNAGIGDNVVQTVKTDTFVTSSATFADVTGLTATITPTSASSKVLIIAQVSCGLANNLSYGHFKLAGGNTSAYVGDASGSRIRGVFGGISVANVGGVQIGLIIQYLDSPASVAPVVYSVQARAGSSGSAHVNRSAADSDTDNNTRGASSLTLIEVSA
jgi:hypothetical protein